MFSKIIIIKFCIYNQKNNHKIQTKNIKFSSKKFKLNVL